MAEHVFEALHTAVLFRRWKRILMQSEGEDGVFMEEGAILLARSLMPCTELLENDNAAFWLHGPVQQQLDECAAQLRSRLGGNGSAEETTVDDVTAVQTLTDLLGLRGITPHEDYYDVRNSSLAYVLQSRRGIPLTLAVLCKLILRRCDIVVDIVGLPGHVVLGCPGGGGGNRQAQQPMRFVDIFHGSRVLSQDDCIDLVNMHGFPFRPAFLQPLPAAAVLGRMMNNIAACLTRHFHARGRTVRTLGQLERVQTLQEFLDGHHQMNENVEVYLPELTLDPEIFVRNGLIDSDTAARCNEAFTAQKEVYLAQ